MSDKFPMWARKPNHKSKVIATPNGWVVESTGELLVRVRDLDKKLAEYLGAETVTFDNETSEIVITDTVSEDVPPVEEVVQPVVVDPLPVTELTNDEVIAPVIEDEEVPVLVEEDKDEPEVEEVVEPVKKKAGRPKKVTE